MAVLTGTHPDLIKALERAKLLPPNTRRVIIDIAMDDAVKLFYECYGDERILELNLPQRLHGATIIRARDVDPEPEVHDG